MKEQFSKNFQLGRSVGVETSQNFAITILDSGVIGIFLKIWNIIPNDLERTKSEIGFLPFSIGYFIGLNQGFFDPIQYIQVKKNDVIIRA